MITKIILFFFILAICYLVKEAFLFVRALLTNGDDYKMTEPRLWGVGVSIAYVLTIIILGFN